MKYRPVNDKVLIKKDKLDSNDNYTTKSGIEVINSATRHKGRVALGEVIDIGSTYVNENGSRVDISTLVKPGDKVLYYYPAEISLDGDLVLVRAIDIDAVIEGNNISLR